MVKMTGKGYLRKAHQFKGPLGVHVAALHVYKAILDGSVDQLARNLRLGLAARNVDDRYIRRRHVFFFSGLSTCF